MKFVVLSDLHLGPPGSAVNGLDPAARLAEAVRAINRDHANADFVAIAGDLADLGEVGAYEVLRDTLAPLTMPCHITLGNHDAPEAFLSVFGADLAHPDAKVSKVINVEGYRVILLDTTTPGTHGGALCQGRMDWLAARLDEAADLPVIVVMHHHANVLSLPVDEIPLEDGAGFAQLLKRHPDVRMVISGHVHLTTSGVWHGVPMTTLAGSHYSVNAHLPGMAGDQLRLEGPAQMAVVLADVAGVTVHFQDYLPRHVELASGLFPKE
jgi:3',5'-cyclic AMP phosphodiesterase CpdA